MEGTGRSGTGGKRNASARVLALDRLFAQMQLVREAIEFIAFVVTQDGEA